MEGYIQKTGTTEWNFIQASMAYYLKFVEGITPNYIYLEGYNAVLLFNLR